MTVIDEHTAAGVTTVAGVMGTTAHVVLTGTTAPHPDVVIDRLRELEQRWSRFRPDSELSQLTRAGGGATVVSHDTALLIERAVRAWHLTGGRFDPTVLDAVRSAGYDRTFEQLATRTSEIGSRSGAPSPAVPGCDGVEVYPGTDLVCLPPGVAIDPGGIGKGLAADLAAMMAVDLGATAAMVSLGGDLRVVGEPPAQGWEIELDHHVAAPARINLRSGAVATSSTLVRRWSTPDGPAHHVIDPRTGRPSTGAAVACSVIAAESWWAEALATAILVGWGEDGWGDDLTTLLRDAGALVTFADGSQTSLGPFAASFSLDDTRPEGGQR